MSEVSEHKYTSDGRKVVVIGKLNSNETIVQEIFVSGDAEIPSGEQFIVKSLHDQPAESWKEKKLRELENRFKKESADWDRKIKELCKNQSARFEKMKEMGACLNQLAQNWNVESLKTLANFVTEKITHVVDISYNPKIYPFMDLAAASDWDGDVDGIKLISLFGATDGDLKWGINKYRDGSGNWFEIVPCTSFEQAVAALDDYIKKITEKHGAKDWMLKVQKEYGLQNPTEEAKQTYFALRIALLDKAIAKQKAILSRNEAIKADIEKLIISKPPIGESN